MLETRVPFVVVWPIGKRAAVTRFAGKSGTGKKLQREENQWRFHTRLSLVVAFTRYVARGGENSIAALRTTKLTNKPRTNEQASVSTDEERIERNDRDGHG